jgi:Ca-activated chloride channel family protein
VRIEFPALRFLSGAPATPRTRWPWLPNALRLLGVVLLVAALARPQSPQHVEDIRIRSRNLMIALDISSSMKAGDFQPGNRLQVARRVLADFVRRRDGDLMGLVIFSGRAFLQAPLTPDTELLDRLLQQVDIGQLPDGTAIGTALALSIGQLKDLPPEASAVVLVTDGANNTGTPSPYVAAEAAKALGVRIHAIGLSTADTTGFESDGFVWREGRRADRLTSADEAVMKRITSRTGGKYYRATDPDALEKVFAEIEELERNEVRIGETRDYRELFPFLLFPAVMLLGAELALGLGRWRGLP